MRGYFEKVLRRAKKIIDVENDAQVAEAIGMTPSAFNNRKRSGSVPFSHFVSFARARFVDMNWLFHDDDSRYDDNTPLFIDSKTSPPADDLELYEQVALVAETESSRKPDGELEKLLIKHKRLLEAFADRETGVEFNQVLLKIEQLNSKEYYSLLGYAKRILVELSKSHNLSSRYPPDIKSQVPSAKPKA